MNPDTHITHKNGLPHSKYCRITPGGTVAIKDQPGVWPYEIPIHKLQDLQQFSRWFCHLSEKTWFTPEVAADFTLFCCLLIHGAPEHWRRFVGHSEQTAG